jgi:transcriptional antiterminator NusG
MAEEAKWYVVHTYSGYENTVKATIDKTIEAKQLHDVIQQVIIPMETVTEMTDSGPKTYDRKVFPGYVLVKMIMNDENWYTIRNVRGVTGFVGASSTNPTPLSEKETIQWGVERHEIVVSFGVGDTVRIVDGPLTSFSGRVDALDIEKNSVRVVVSMFGRETPVELELDQVENISE